MEADFQREYGIDLSVPAVMREMSWRRFMVLVRGLGPHSATQQSMYLRTFQSSPGRPPEPVEVVEGPEAVLASLGASFGSKDPN